MPRQARVVIPGAAHHINQRGNNQQDVFFVAEDRTAYLDVLRTQCRKHGVRVLGYCLMTNHVHLIAVPSREDSLHLAVGRAHFILTQRINLLHGRTGHLWQGRFCSCAMDDAHTMAALRYIERNPVRAKMTRAPWTYRWSSAAAHTGQTDTSELLDLAWWRDISTDLNWKEVLSESEDGRSQAALRGHTHTGRPLGSDSFLSKLEHRLGRRLRALPIGRPKKRKTIARQK